MVILAGSGHIAFGSGIPSRLERRIHASYAIVLSSGEAIEPRIADYILLSNRQQLPPTGALGAGLAEAGGECRIHSLDPAGSADKAGLKKGDALVVVDGQPVKTLADVRLALWVKKPRQRVVVRAHRGRRPGTNASREYEVELAAAANGGQSLYAAAGRRALRGLGDFVGVAPVGSAAGARRSNCRAWQRTRFARGADCRRARTLSPALSAEPRFLPAPRAATSVPSRSAAGAPRRTAACGRGRGWGGKQLCC